MRLGAASESNLCVPSLHVQVRDLWAQKDLDLAPSPTISKEMKAHTAVLFSLTACTYA